MEILAEDKEKKTVNLYQASATGFVLVGQFIGNRKTQ